MCDINAELIERWNTDDLPFFEPQLDEYFRKAKHEFGNIEFTTDVDRSILQADVIFISVNTPPMQVAASLRIAPSVMNDQAAGNAASERHPIEKVSLGVQTDMRAFYSVVQQIGKVVSKRVSEIKKDNSKAIHKILVEKSTVPLGTAKQMHKLLSEAVQNVDSLFTIVNMPEFLAEGSAIADLVSPQRVVIGTKSDNAFTLMRKLSVGS